MHKTGTKGEHQVYTIKQTLTDSKSTIQISGLRNFTKSDYTSTNYHNTNQMFHRSKYVRLTLHTSYADRHRHCVWIIAMPYMQTYNSSGYNKHKNIMALQINNCTQYHLCMYVFSFCMDTQKCKSCYYSIFNPSLRHTHTKPATCDAPLHSPLVHMLASIQ